MAEAPQERHCPVCYSEREEWYDRCPVCNIKFFGDAATTAGVSSRDADVRSMWFAVRTLTKELLIIIWINIMMVLLGVVMGVIASGIASQPSLGLTHPFVLMFSICAGFLSYVGLRSVACKLLGISGTGRIFIFSWEKLSLGQHYRGASLVFSLLITGVIVTIVIIIINALLARFYFV